jgi:hypothetical protein
MMYVCITTISSKLKPTWHDFTFILDSVSSYGPHWPLCSVLPVLRRAASTLLSTSGPSGLLLFTLGLEVRLRGDVLALRLGRGGGRVRGLFRMEA